MLTLKTPGRRRVLAGAMALSVLGLGTGYAAWAFAPQPPALTNSQTPQPGLDPTERPERVAAPPGYKSALLAALGLPADARLNISCYSPSADECTYASNDGVHRPMTPAGSAVIRKLNPAFAAEEAAFLESRTGFVPVPRFPQEVETPQPAALTNSTLEPRPAPAGTAPVPGSGLVISGAEPQTPEARTAAQRSRESLEAAIQAGTLRGVDNVVQYPDGRITFTAKSVSREVALASLRGEGLTFDAPTQGTEAPAR